MQNGSCSLPCKDKTLEKIIDWVNKVEEPSMVSLDDGLRTLFEAQYLEGLVLDEIVELLNIAEFFNLKSLITFCASNIAERLQNKTVDEMREFFQVQNDFASDDKDFLEMEQLFQALL